MARCRSKKAGNSGHSAVQGVLLRGESFMQECGLEE